MVEVCPKSQIPQQKVYFWSSLSLLASVFIVLCKVKENTEKSTELTSSRMSWWGVLFSYWNMGSREQKPERGRPWGLAVCHIHDPFLPPALFLLSAQISKVMASGQLPSVQRISSKQRCAMPRQASQAPLRKTENDIVNWGTDIWRVVPIFSYLTGLSKLNALAGTAGSDTVTFHILGR